MTKICHIISNLNAGGAETMLLRLLQTIDKEQYSPIVISLTDIGPIGREIAASGITVKALGMRRGLPGPLAMLRLVRILRHYKPALVHTWMYHADLLGGLAARLAGNPPVVWAVHHATLNPATTRRTTIYAARLCARLSSWVPKRIIYCSTASRDNHQAMGYKPTITTLIPNGFDLSALYPSTENRCEVRTELGIDDSVPLVGLIARFHPDKDHLTFCKAAGLLLKNMPNVHFLLCGNDISTKNTALMQMIQDAKIEKACHLLGNRNDVAHLLGALDITVCSSCSEAFPLVLGEAMACGVPCVATDVGDNALIIGDTGQIAPPSSPEHLARSMAEMLSLPADSRCALGKRARARITEKFALNQTAQAYQDLYSDLTS